MLPRMNVQQRRRANKLLKHLCANYQDGNCLLLDDDEPCVCVQSISYSLCCNYFRVAVLPTEPTLEAEMHNIITRINNEFNDKITDIKTDNPHDKLVMSGSKAEWREVLAIYAVAYNMTDMHPANPDEVQVVTLDESKEEYIRNLFWEINKIDHRIETYTETEQVEEKQKDGKVKKVNKQVQKKALYITVSHVDLETMMNNKGFTAEQKKMCRQLLSDENNDLWRELLNGVTSSNSDIVLIAQEQLGNVGGKPYWSWYGFSSRVEWCCCFVSWCANECGYIESGTIPKYSVVDDGVVWFKNKDQWLDGSEEPEPGMIIFFDWADDGLDGGGDHTGIVEKVEGGTVYTIEGNSGDKVCENQYSIGNKEILGYGYYSGNNTVATGDTAQQVWTYLKSYGYSDSVAAGAAIHLISIGTSSDTTTVMNSTACVNGV